MDIDAAATFFVGTILVGLGIIIINDQIGSDPRHND